MQSLRELLPGVLRSLARNPELSLIFLQELWPRLAGEEVSRHLKPVRLHGRCLVCEAGDPEWSRQLVQLQPLLVRAVNRQWGMRLIERIEIRIRPSKKDGW